MTSPGTSNQRATRHAVNLFVGYDIDTPPFGRTRDLSSSGIFVETKDRPSIGDMVDIHMVWGDEDVTCQAKVARHADEGIGLAFVEPNAWYLTCVEEILEASPPVRVGHRPE